MDVVSCAVVGETPGHCRFVDSGTCGVRGMSRSQEWSGSHAAAMEG